MEKKILILDNMVRGAFNSGVYPRDATMILDITITQCSSPY